LWQQLNEEMAAIIAKVRRSLVQISNGRGGVGAGTVWHADGLIVTNAHVLAGRDHLNVTLPDQWTLPARLLAVDPEHDLAALSVSATGLTTIELSEAPSLAPGQWVLALGHPWGVLGAVTAGTVIDVGAPPEIARSRGEFIQVGLHLRPGHSGGPLVDVYGRLVGINTMIAGPDVGLAIPLPVVKAFLRQTLGSPSPAAPSPEYI
jgi:S1-C subfamily serine protease